MPPSRAPGPEPIVRTFDEAFAELNLTSDERAELVWHLAAMRARKTIEALLPGRPEYGTHNEEMLSMLRNGHNG